METGAILRAEKEEAVLGICVVQANLDKEYLRVARELKEKFDRDIVLLSWVGRLSVAKVRLD